MAYYHFGVSRKQNLNASVTIICRNFNIIQKKLVIIIKFA